MEVIAFVFAVYLFVTLFSTPSRVEELEEQVEVLQRRTAAQRPRPRRRRRLVAGERSRSR